MYNNINVYFTIGNGNIISSICLLDWMEEKKAKQQHAIKQKHSIIADLSTTLAVAVMTLS